MAVEMSPPVPSRPRRFPNVGIWTEVEERKPVEEQLRESKQRTLAFCDNSPNPIFLKDTELRYLYVNREFERALRIDREQVRGKRDLDLFAPEQASTFQANDLKVLEAGVPIEFEEVAQHEDGPHTSIVHKFPLLDAAGKIYAIGGIVTDITERIRSREALERAQEELERVARITMMGELTASIAHEINQPLTSIVSNANACSRMLSAKSPDMKEIAAAVADIAEEATHASEVISRIRMFLKNGARVRAPVYLNEIIREVLTLIRGEILKNQIAIRIELCAELPPVLGDRVELQQVILNLIMNGIEAMTSITNVSRKLLIQSGTLEPPGVLVSVQDTGVGIDPRNMHRIFDPFFTSKLGGMGMGLSIGRSIIEAHGGRLWVESQSDRGAVFQFTLPILDGGTPW
jgi:PAS domain S-box-containing protein